MRSADRGEDRGRHLWWTVEVGIGLLTSLVTVSSAGAQHPVPPRFVAHSAAPVPIRGTLTHLDANGAVRLSTPDGTVPAGELVSLRREGRALPRGSRQPGILLANGDRIRGTITGGDSRVVIFDPLPKGRTERDIWTVPISALAAVWVTDQPSDMPADPGDYPWVGGNRRRDAVLLRNGDVVRGTIDGFASGSMAVRIKSAGGDSTEYPLGQVTAIAFDPSLARLRKPRGPYTRLVVTDGSRLTLTSATVDAGTLRGVTAFGADVELPLTEVVALDVMQGKATYLSDLKPRRADVVGFNGVRWPWVPDRSVKGNELRIGDRTYDKGIGTHSRTTLVYDLGGKYRRFETSIGLDSTTGRRGAVDARILVDGKEVPPDGLRNLTAGATPRDIAVDVTSARELTLIVDYGAGGDVQDDLNWGDARLIE